MGMAPRRIVPPQTLQAALASAITACRPNPSNTMRDLPLAALIATICGYWIGVGVMIVRVRRKTKRAVGIVPEQRLERLMWLVWVPLVAAWIYVPWATFARGSAFAAAPLFAMTDPVLRWIAAFVAVLALAGTIRCWLRMGDDWRMDVGLDGQGTLITDGPFARIRHPIYALSILLMLCTLVIVPTAPMLVIAAVHIALMNMKARNEERHLLAVHGDAYARYLQRTGRFFPRLTAHSG
jgi:protein-S-isoprenylcysteine O-methyltransferase Ste14